MLLKRHVKRKTAKEKVLTSQREAGENKRLPAGTSGRREHSSQGGKRGGGGSSKHLGGGIVMKGGRNCAETRRRKEKGQRVTRNIEEKKEKSGLLPGKRGGGMNIPYRGIRLRSGS